MPELSNKNILITGGAGFIGSNFVHYIIQSKVNKIVILDKLTYAGNIDSIKDAVDNVRVFFIHGSINDEELVASLLKEFSIDFVVNFAAETHVDNSINSPDIFISTNIVGTFSLLKKSHEYWQRLPAYKIDSFRFIHISTDEVFGSLSIDSDEKFNESSPYKPNSPYSASKASSDHLVRSFVHTYNFPAIITNCSNNYGPRQHAEKLIPKTILSCLHKKPIEVYGDGRNVRDWIYVDDHCMGIVLTLTRGAIGESYLFGGENERSNIDLVNIICGIVDESCKKLITFVPDRKGHDKRYAIDNTGARKKLGYAPGSNDFTANLKGIIEWYRYN